MANYKTKAVLDFLAKHVSDGTPEELLKNLIYNDLALVTDDSVSSTEDLLKMLGSLRGFSQPKFVDLKDEDSGYTDGKEIFINSNHSKSRQLFTWGHEICHSYFDKSSGVKTDAFGKEFHCSCENTEEEGLCDFGSSLILFYGVDSDNFSIDALLKIVSDTKASAEAVAISMLKNTNSEMGMIVWRRKCKKGENLTQTSLFSEEIKHPFRIDYASSEDVFLPGNKSVDEGNSIDLCEIDGRSSGVIGMKLKNGMVNFRTDNLKISGNRILTLFQK